MFERLAVAIIAVVAAGCGKSGPPPETPTLVSISGHGTATITGNSGTFQFNAGTHNPTTGAYVSPSGSTVVFTAPYPTSIEAFIDGKPLTKVDPLHSDRYEYSAEIVNPGGNPAKWSMGVRTPYDVPFFKYQTQTSYVLTIVDVSGSQRSAPLTIRYFNPAPYSLPLPGYASTGSTTYSTDSPKGSGTCPGGGQEKAYSFCFRKANTSPYTAGTTACSESQALQMLSFQYPSSEYSHTSGVCH